jgi:hypothetical protein
MHLNAIERSRQLDAVNAELSRLNETLEASVQARRRSSLPHSIRSAARRG